MVLKSPLERERSAGIPRKPTADNPTSTVEDALAYVKQHAGVSDYNDLTNKPTLGTAAAADTGDFATAAQGALADSATQPGDLATVATSGSYNDLTDKPSAGTGDVAGPASSTDANIALFDGTDGKKIKDSGFSISDLIALGSTPRNRVVNPGLSYAQVGLGAASDGDYSGIDQWLVLTETASVASSLLTNVADGVPSMGRLTQSQSTAQRMGWLQPLESSFVKDLRGKDCALAAKVRLSTSSKLRYAVIEWTGTKDSITKDVVNGWTNTTFTTGNFFKSTGLTIAATGDIDLSADTLADIEISATLSSSMNNIMLFVWTDSAQAQNVTLDLGNVWFGLGASSPATFDPPAPDADFAKCLRYISVVTPGTTLTVGVGYVIGAGAQVRLMVPITVPFRVTPSASFVGGTGITTTTLSDVTGTPKFASGISVNSFDSSHVWLVLTTSGLTNATPTVWLFAGNTSGSLIFDARL